MTGYSRSKSDQTKVVMLQSSISQAPSANLSYWVSRTLGYVSLVGTVSVCIVAVFA